MSSVEYLPERVSMLYRLSGTDVPDHPRCGEYYTRLHYGVHIGAT
jgi:hypothetical protein